MLWELGGEMREVYTWASVLLVCVQVWSSVCVCVYKGGEDGVYVLGNLSEHLLNHSRGLW